MYKLDILDKETEKLHQLLKLIKDNKHKEDRVWEKFCKEMDKAKEPTKKYFQKHPQNMSNSSSEILSPRRNDNFLMSKRPNRAKSTNSIRFPRPGDNAYIAEGASNGSDVSVEVVTLREEYPNRKKLKTSEGTKHVRISKSTDRKLTKSKDNMKHVKINENISQDSISKVKSLKTLKRSPLQNAQKEEVPTDMHRDNFELKLHSILEKSLHCMEDIRMQLDIGITQPDGLDDFEGRKRRSTEFASRFSRNYVYQLNRQISDLKKLLKQSPGRISDQNSSLIKQRLTSSYQTVLQGLQAYLTHLPISTSVSVPEKIKELLKEIGTLCEIQRTFANADVNMKSTELADIFEVRSRCLIDKVDECYSAPSAVTLLQSVSKYSLMQGGKTRKPNSIKPRYSMYNGSTGRKEVYWKRAVAALAKKKYNVPSKYKTAHFKHRPPIDRSSNIKQPTIKAKHLERKSSTNLKAKPVVDDENIKTMMEIEREKDMELGTRGSLSSFQKTDDDFYTKNDTLVPLVEKLIEEIRVENKDMTQEHVRCVLQGIAENAAKPSDSDNAIGELAAKLLVSEDVQKKSVETNTLNDHLIGRLVEVVKNHAKKASCEKRPEEVEHDQVDGRIAKKKKRKDRKKTVSVTGAKNAQLICIRDEDSLIEPSTEENATDGTHACNQVNNAPKSKSQLQVNNQTISIEGGNPNAQKDSTQQESPSNETVTRLGSGERTSRVKISRLPKVPLQPLKMLPKKFALNILEYKINYLKARKGDHMYKKSSVKQPWILMGEISDKILDELLQAIGCEIEVNDVIEGIFASEFI